MGGGGKARRVSPAATTARPHALALAVPYGAIIANQLGHASISESCRGRRVFLVDGHGAAMAVSAEVIQHVDLSPEAVRLNYHLSMDISVSSVSCVSFVSCVAGV